MFPQCKLFADFSGTTSGLGIGTFLLCFVQRLYWHLWDCVNIYLVTNPVSHPHYVKLGFKVMVAVENGKVKDWRDVKKNVRECAEMEGVATNRNKPMVLRSFLMEGDWSLASMCRRLVPSTSLNVTPAKNLLEKYKKVVNACVVELDEEPIAIVDYCIQNVAIEAFSKELGRMQAINATKEATVRNCLSEFWQKAATANIVRDGHVTIYKLLGLYREYLRKNLYDDLMLLNRFEIELLTNVTVVPLLTDVGEMNNIRCNFYCYKYEKFIGTDVGGFSVEEVATNGAKIVHGHFFGKVGVPSSLLYLKKESKQMIGF